MKLHSRYLLPVWLLLVACRANVVGTRTAKRSEDDLGKRYQANKDISTAGSTKRIHEIAEAVTRIQEEPQNDGSEMQKSLRRRIANDKSNAEEDKKNSTKWNDKNMDAGLGEKMLEAGGKLLPRELKSRMKNNEKDEQDSTTGIEKKGKRGLEKRANPVAGQMSAKAGEKAVDMAGKMAEKQMETMEKQKGKVDQFLGEQIKLDITGDKGWKTDDMFIPPGYHMEAKIEPESKPAPVVNGQPPFTFPFGAGGMIMNGCFGTGYKPGDRCYDATWATTKCLDLIPGATFIGVGFDGRGDYSPDSSRMDLVQRACTRKQRYNGKMIPDTMKLLGVYDTQANMQVFYSRSEFQKYLEQQSGASGSGFGFYGGVKKAWGSSTTSGSQKYLAVFDIDVDRYEIFMDVVKPDNLNIGFLREFMMLPTSYYETGAAIKFQDFIQRFGTHYIKAGRFGGQLEIRKSMEASEVSSKEEFSEVMEFEYKSFFASAGARSSDKAGESAMSQTKTSSTSMSVQGGNQEIASIISDVYAPTFKAEFKQWLKSIPQYPKAFKFTISPITDLLNFRSSDLFPEEAASFGCEAHKAELKRDPITNKFYYNATVNGTLVKEFCDYLSREALEYSIRQRRTSLKRAIDVYMEEGSISVSDINLPPGTPGCETQNYKYQVKAGRPTWIGMTEHHTAFKVIFKMDNDLAGSYHGMVKIPSHLESIVRYIDGEWVVSKDDDKFDFFSGCNRGGSGDIKSEEHYICIYGLVLKHDERMGTLNLDEHGYNVSKQTFRTLDPNLIGGELARIEWPADHIFQMREVVGYLPCNVKWSNALRFDPSGEGRCLHFTASTKGTVFVIFSAIPKDPNTWYYVQISPYGVGIFKSQTLKVSSVDIDAVGLGDEILYQPYFVCVKREPKATVIEYGKSQGTTENGEIYLSMIDKENPLHVRFYAFGNGEDSLEIADAHILRRTLTTAECKGDTHKDEGTNMCLQKCHKMCDPLRGCKSTSSVEPLPTDCNACLYFKRIDTGECIETCPEGFKEKEKTCVPKDCQKNPCLNGGTCRELGKEEYNCKCTEDYKGDHCEIGVKGCQLNPCKNGAICIDKEEGTYQCQCKDGWTGQDCETECGHEALGMENGKIKDQQISASSQYSDSFAAHQARLITSNKPWVTMEVDKPQWLQIDLGNPHTVVTRVATMGSVNTYKLQYSDNGREFQYFKEQGLATDKVFEGNKEFRKVVTNDLNPPIRARYIRFRPTTWNRYIVMKVELYGCQG